MLTHVILKFVRFAHLFHAKTQKANPETSGAKENKGFTDF